MPNLIYFWTGEILEQHDRTRDSLQIPSKISRINSISDKKGVNDNLTIVANSTVQ
jgi:hypothetical protein